MKTLLLTILAAASFAFPAFAEPVTAQIGQPAPDFKAMDTNGKEQTLSQYKGKTIILEWTNPECPYVVKHYGSGNMQALQKEAAEAGAIWLTIASSAKGKQGYMVNSDANAWTGTQKAMPTARLVDDSGAIGHLYAAKTTPHMYVVNPEGILVYSGAIDDNDSFKPETIAGAKNYIRETLKAIKDGSPVSVASTKPYGCSVKYAY